MWITVKRIIQFFRLLQINMVLISYTFTPEVVGSRYPLLRFLAYFNIWRHFGRKTQSRGESIRFALESLGPIFVKFGQLLSTRRDLLPEDIAMELSKLQDQVPPFSSALARKMIEQTFQRKIEDIFLRFDDNPLASASIAQVHSAALPNQQEVVVKIIRPRIRTIIRHDIAIMYSVARLTARFWSHGRRLRLIELVSEFENSLMDELDLQKEAANASQLRRNFLSSTQLYIPKIYWDYVRTSVMIMERIHGIRISDYYRLKEKNCNLKKLAENGVEMFFTQVFRDNFFHADMHPGNLFVDCVDPENPKFLLVDFGIMGSLSPSDQHYLAQNLIAFLDRDYKRVAILHVESGWVPPYTRVEQFESAIRTVCEPIFERPLYDISFGQLLLRLFTTAERFNMEIQPQLMLLQKTLLNIEGLGRQLYPQLDIWATAKPFMERWIREQRSIKKIFDFRYEDIHDTAEKLLKMPKVLYSLLQVLHIQQETGKEPLAKEFEVITQLKKRQFFFGASGLMLLIAFINTVAKTHWFGPHEFWPWLIGGGLLLIGWLIPVKTS